MIKEEKSYYEKKIEELNKLPTIKEKKAFIKALDFDKKIEKDSDATIIKEMQIFEAIPWKDEKETKIKVNEKVKNYLDKSDLAKEIWKIQHYFYDKSKMWWLWDNNETKWVLVDEKDILIMVSDNSEANTINSLSKKQLYSLFEDNCKPHIAFLLKHFYQMHFLLSKCLIHLLFLHKILLN